MRARAPEPADAGPRRIGDELSAFDVPARTRNDAELTQVMDGLSVAQLRGLARFDGGRMHGRTLDALRAHGLVQQTAVALTGDGERVRDRVRWQDAAAAWAGLHGVAMDRGGYLHADGATSYAALPRALRVERDEVAAPLALVHAGDGRGPRQVQGWWGLATHLERLGEIMRTGDGRWVARDNGLPSGGAR